MESGPEPTRERPRRRRGCGCGCGGFFVVLIVGGILSLANLVVGVGVTVRVPLTPSNLTLAAAIGSKAQVTGALPPYTHGLLGGNQNFLNQSQTLTIGPAEGASIIVLGRQEGAPAFDLYVVAR